MLLYKIPGRKFAHAKHRAQKIPILPLYSAFLKCLHCSEVDRKFRYGHDGGLKGKDVAMEIVKQ